MSASYYSFDCIPFADGRLKVIDVQGSVGSGLGELTAGYGGQAGARARLRPYLERLGEIADGRKILFHHDPYHARQSFPDDFFNLVQQYVACGPLTDWVPDLDATARGASLGRTPGLEEMGVFLDPLAGRLRLSIGYCSVVRVDYQTGEPKLLVSGYRERVRQRGTTKIFAPDEIGVLVFSGNSARFPDDLKRQDWFPTLNPPLLDQVLEHKWLPSFLLQGLPEEALFPRMVPVGMGLRTNHEIAAFARDLSLPSGFPSAVLRPSLQGLYPGARFLDRTALRSLAARQPDHRTPHGLAEELLLPRVSHSYEEISGYRGKVLDNLLRTAGAEVLDHGDGSFHFNAPYPFLESTVGILQEFLDAEPLRSKRTGKLHRGSLRAVLFDGKLVSAIYRFDAESAEGTFRDLSRPEVPVFYEAAPPEQEEAIEGQLSGLARALDEQVTARVHSAGDVESLLRRWLGTQTLPA